MAEGARAIFHSRSREKVSRILRVHFQRVRSAAIGPDLSHRRTVVEQMLLSPSVRKAIEEQARKEKSSESKARKTARKYGYEIAADYEMLIRLLYVHKLKYKYLPIKMVKMRKGGVSSNGIRSNIVLNNEIIRACRKHGIKTNAFKIYPKYFKKILELFNHK